MNFYFQIQLTPKLVLTLKSTRYNQFSYGADSGNGEFVTLNY